MYGLDSTVRFAALPLATRIDLALAQLVGWRYGGPFFPTRPGWFPTRTRVASAPAEELIDCSSLVAWLLAQVYPMAPWSQTEYRELQVFDVSKPFSAMDAVVRVGVGRRWNSAESPADGDTVLVQNWRKLDPPEGGHLYLARVKSKEFVEVIESTSRDDNGDGARDGVQRVVRRGWLDLPPGHKQCVVLTPNGLVGA